MQYRHFLDLCACLPLADLTLQMFTGMSKPALSSWKVCSQYDGSCVGLSFPSILSNRAASSQTERWGFALPALAQSLKAPGAGGGCR